MGTRKCYFEHLFTKIKLLSLSVIKDKSLAIIWRLSYNLTVCEGSSRAGQTGRAGTEQQVQDWHHLLQAWTGVGGGDVQQWWVWSAWSHDCHVSVM